METLLKVLRRFEKINDTFYERHELLLNLHNTYLLSVNIYVATTTVQQKKPPPTTVGSIALVGRALARRR